MERALPLGKLPAAELARLLDRLAGEPSVLVGPAPGEDAAVIRPQAGALLVAAADPITFPTARPGWLAVHVNANDVATRGGRPRWFLATLLLPAGASAVEAESLLADICSACSEVGAVLVGGHTEITPTVSTPVVAGCMLGEVSPDLVRRTGGARPGDHLVLAGFAGVEGTSILAGVAGEALRAAGLEADTIAYASSMVEGLGISVLTAAMAATPLAHALHDLTEGGLATGVRELAEAAAVGAVLELERVLVRAETVAVCQALGLDWLGLLSSGCLLVATPPDDAAAVLQALARAGVPAALCGRCLEPGSGIWLEREGRRQPLPLFARDELARWLERHEET